MSSFDSPSKVSPGQWISPALRVQEYGQEDGFLQQDYVLFEPNLPSCDQSRRDYGNVPPRLSMRLAVISSIMTTLEIISALQYDNAGLFQAAPGRSDPGNVQWQGSPRLARMDRAMADRGSDPACTSGSPGSIRNPSRDSCPTTVVHRLKLLCASALERSGGKGERT